MDVTHLWRPPRNILAYFRSRLLRALLRMTFNLGFLLDVALGGAIDASGILPIKDSVSAQWRKWDLELICT